MLSLHRPRLDGGLNMPKATCVQNVTFGATGEVYESGVEYDVPDTTFKRYPDYFKRASAPKTKKAKTEENK
jgi:hypothetical protein